MDTKHKDTVAQEVAPKKVSRRPTIVSRLLESHSKDCIYDYVRRIIVCRCDDILHPVEIDPYEKCVSTTTTGELQQNIEDLVERVHVLEQSLLESLNIMEQFQVCISCEWPLTSDMSEKTRKLAATLRQHMNLPPADSARPPIKSLCLGCLRVCRPFH